MFNIINILGDNSEKKVSFSPYTYDLYVIINIWKAINISNCYVWPIFNELKKMQRLKQIILT